MAKFWENLHWFATLGVLFSASWWWRVFWLKSLPLPSVLMVDTLHFYHFGYFGALVLACVAWGGRGWKNLLGWRGLWVLGLWQFALWGRINLGADTRNLAVGIGETSEFFWVALFITALVAHPPPLRWLWWALVLGMLFQVGLGWAQVLNQAEVGIEALASPLNLKEFDLDPQRSGVSVVGSARFLRPYGLSAHPNLMAGAVVIGFLMGVAVFPRHWWLGMIAWWGIWLSFSRAALGGAILGLALILLWRASKRHLQLVAALAAVSLLFAALYPNLVLGRLGPKDSQNPSFETFSAASRAVYIEQAQAIIPEHFWRGLGRGNFAWESAYLLACCDTRDLRGDHVHNIYLLIWAEVGLVGLAWFGLLLAGSGFYAWQKRHSLDPIQVGAVAAGLAWLGIGWFDHYPWTQFGHQILFWTCWAIPLFLAETPTSQSNPPEYNPAI